MKRKNEDFCGALQKIFPRYVEIDNQQGFFSRRSAQLNNKNLSNLSNKTFAQLKQNNCQNQPLSVVLEML